MYSLSSPSKLTRPRPSSSTAEASSSVSANERASPRRAWAITAAAQFSSRPGVSGPAARSWILNGNPKCCRATSTVWSTMLVSVKLPRLSTSTSKALFPVLSRRGRCTICRGVNPIRRLLAILDGFRFPGRGLGRRISGMPRETSTRVEGRGSPEGPPFRMRSTSRPRTSAASSALRTGGRPERLALVLVIGPPAWRSKAPASRASDVRSASVDVDPSRCFGRPRATRGTRG